MAALVWWVGHGFPGVRGTTGTGTPINTGTPSTTATPETTGPPVTIAPTSSVPPKPAPRQSATVAPVQNAAPGVPRPTSCTRLYSPDMVQALGDLTLNPAWRQDSDSGVSHGTDDAELRAQIDSLGHLTCVWASPYGGSDSGIITNVAWVTTEWPGSPQSGLGHLRGECRSGGRTLRKRTLVFRPIRGSPLHHLDQHGGRRLR